MPNPCLENALGGRITILYKHYYIKVFNNPCAKFVQKNFGGFFCITDRRISNFVIIKSPTQKGRGKMSINKIRSALYKSAKIFGDVNAVKNGTIGKRIARRAAGKATSKLFRNLFK